MSPSPTYSLRVASDSPTGLVPSSQPIRMLSAGEDARAEQVELAISALSWRGAHAWLLLGVLGEVASSLPLSEAAASGVETIRAENAWAPPHSNCTQTPGHQCPPTTQSCTSRVPQGAMGRWAPQAVPCLLSLPRVCHKLPHSLISTGQVKGCQSKTGKSQGHTSFLRTRALPRGWPFCLLLVCTPVLEGFG